MIVVNPLLFDNHTTEDVDLYIKAEKYLYSMTLNTY